MKKREKRSKSYVGLYGLVLMHLLNLNRDQEVK